MSTLGALQRNKWPILIILAAVFLFYWYELRPVWAYRSCSRQASVDARALLRSKAEIAKGTSKGASYQKLIDKNMYLRSDYESFLQKCLIYYGLTMPPAMQKGTASSGEEVGAQ
jgi:hypothetical protein